MSRESELQAIADRIQGPYFATPEQVSVYHGIPVTTVKRLAKAYGTCTRLERNRLAFSPENVADLSARISNPPRPHQDPTDPNFDPFAPTPRIPK